MDLFYVFLILLVGTRAGAEVAGRVEQPVLVGELIAGITLGAIVAEYPASFPDLLGLASNDVFFTITGLGMLFLMMFADVEMRRHKFVGILAAIRQRQPPKLVLMIDARNSFVYLPRRRHQ